jgi:multimeric flavodoxin WrbA
MSTRTLKNAVIICDRDAATALSDDLKRRVVALLQTRGYRIELVELIRADAAPCRGCLLCFTKHPGKCVSNDAVGDLVQRMRLDPEDSITLYLTPVLFGHPSPVTKNALDRGTGSHRLQVIIGYGQDIDGEEESTFIDITAKHCGAADIVHPGMVREAMAFVTRSAEDNASVCSALQEQL